MPVKKVQIPPGLDRESTQQSSGPQWYDANNMRFRDKFAQSIAGWQADDANYEVLGFVRGLHAWTDFGDNQFQAIGTTWKYYLVAGTTLVDITPTSGIPAVYVDQLTAVTSSGPMCNVEIANHDRQVNDFIYFPTDASMTTVGGTWTIDDFQTSAQAISGFQVVEVIDSDNFTINMGEDSNTTTGNGSSYTVGFKAHSGTLASTTGSGFGTGAWDGDDFSPDRYLMGTDSMQTKVTASHDVTFLIAGDAANPVTGSDYIYIQGCVGVVDGVDSAYFNNKWHDIRSAAGSNALVRGDTYSLGVQGTTGGSNMSFFHGDASLGPNFPPGDPWTIGATRGWDAGGEAEIQVGSMRTVSIANFGEDLIANNRGGPLYYYDTSTNTSVGIPQVGLPLVEINSTNFVGTTEAPVLVESFIIAEGHGHTVCLGVNDIGNPTVLNRMLVRWSDRHNPFLWLPTASSEAGGDVLRSGSYIVSGIATKDEIVIFTDTSVYSMRYVGAPEMYGINLITANTTSFSRMSAVAVDNSVFFMGNEQFYVYSGSVKPLPKNLSNYVFDNLNHDEKQKVFAGVNSAFTEVLWFYPEVGSFECNRWVSYNYANNTWSMGAYDMQALDQSSGSTPSTPGGTDYMQYNRTAWQDAGVIQNPVASYVVEYNPDNDGLTNETQICSLALHEIGTSGFDGADINHFIESGEVDLDDGYHYAFYDKLIPDIQLFDVESGTSASMVASMDGRDLPGKAQKGASSVTITDFTDALGDPNGRPLTAYAPDFNATTIRGRARSVSIRIETNGSGFSWRAGDTRVRVRPDGKD
jgi:hypothetical protein